jgi:chromosome segregation ATPase
MTTTIKTMMTMIAVASFAGAGVTHAQMQESRQQGENQTRMTEVDTQREDIMNELNTLQEESQKAQEKLADIAQQAVEMNSNIMDLHTKLMDIYQDKLAEYGHPSDEELRRLQTIQQQLQSPEAGNMPEEDRQQLTQEFNAGVAQLQDAQQKAQRHPEVEQAQKAFEDERMKTMIEIDPETEELQSEVEDLQAEIEAIRQSLQSSLQQPQRR